MPAQPYATPAAFNAALKAPAQKTARANGMPMNQLMDVFYFSRLAARVFTADPDGWLIKGGQALLVRYAGAARLSRDIDLQCASPETTVAEAAARLIAAAQRDLGDHLRFAPTRFTPPTWRRLAAARSGSMYTSGRGRPPT
ncbi:nucleotidyl transferase AbiEii/AbiGii toxin family protein [Streptomyces sp. NPDC006992]|uniref:nucleotidyl transferase AbiEii/AbiGii toxin family protein n=1 Tax=Streptomyces sp. NPDC006992 TaxID=3155601 RepID=UPI00340182FF